jgi:alpha-tubulin suppressor-like RCC1 family protein
MAIQSNGTLWAWGNNSLSTLGNNSNAHYSSPIQVGTLSGWSRISGTLNNSMALQSNGSMWSWGLNSYGQLGNIGYYYFYPALKNATGAWGTWTSVDTNQETTLFIDNSNRVWGAGNNSYGQLGSATLTYQSIPIRIGSINTATKVETKSGATTILLL